jgi:hypothetical protein
MTAACRKSPNTATPQSSNRSHVRYGSVASPSGISKFNPRRALFTRSWLGWTGRR